MTAIATNTTKLLNPARTALPQPAPISCQSTLTLPLFTNKQLSRKERLWINERDPEPAGGNSQSARVKQHKQQKTSD
jgi:hypothetical protein